MKMRFGTRTGVLRQPWEKAFGEAARLGFDGVELDIGTDYANTMLWNASGRAQLRKLSEESGAELASVCIGAMWGISLANPDPEVQKEAKEIINGTVKFCNELGAEFRRYSTRTGRQKLDRGTEAMCSSSRGIQGDTRCGKCRRRCLPIRRTSDADN
jgi:sugar phosphate isomerase/epimerase